MNLTSLDADFAALKHAVRINALSPTQIKLVLELIDEWYSNERLSIALLDRTAPIEDTQREIHRYLGTTK